jgi:hypothetical protein
MVLYITMNGKSGTWSRFKAFALRYRRVNATFFERILIRYHFKKFES